MKILIIGAGMSGLTAGRMLHEAGLDVTLLDKGRGVGGRMATRRIGEAVFDHGAQFLTARSDWFTNVVEEWRKYGVVAPWFDSSEAGTHPRFRGSPSINAIAKYLAVGLDVRTSTAVTSIRRSGPQWEVDLGSGEHLLCDVCLITAPVPQALALVSDAGIDEDILRPLGDVEYSPCFAVLCRLSGPSGLPPSGPYRPEGSGMIDLICDNHAKGISDEHCVTIHSSAAFAREHIDDTDGALQLLLAQAGPLLAGEITSSVIHRWRYAQPMTTYHAPFGLLSTQPPLLIAGDAFGGPRIEGAALSGHAAASHIMTL